MNRSPDTDPAGDPRWAGLDVIAHGANRLCAVDPEDPEHCLKFELPAPSRTRVGLRQRLLRALARHLPHLDDNHTELRAWRRLHRRLGEEAAGRFAACDAIVATPWGPALRCRLLRLRDGRPARSLHRHLLDGSAYDAERLCAAATAFERYLQSRRIPLFDLNAGNLVVVEDGDAPRLVCVDAKSTLRGKELLPFSRWSARLLRRKLARRAERLRQRIRAQARPPSVAGSGGGH